MISGVMTLAGAIMICIGSYNIGKLVGRFGGTLIEYLEYLFGE